MAINGVQHDNDPFLSYPPLYRRSCCLPACWRGVTSIPAGGLTTIHPFLIRRPLPRMLPLKSGETQPEQIACALARPSCSIEVSKMYMHILIATDGSALANQAVEHGLGLAKQDKTRVTVISLT